MNKIIGKFLKDMQRQYDRETFKEKTPFDRLECKICSGKYSRYSKSAHSRTKKHTKRVNILTRKLISTLA